MAQRRVRDRARVGADGAAHAGSHQARAAGARARLGTALHFQFAVGHRSSTTPSERIRSTIRGSRAPMTPCAMRSTPRSSASSTFDGSPGLARVAGEPQAGRSRRLEGRPLRRCRVADLIAGQVEAHDAPSGKLPACLRERDVVLRRCDGASRRRSRPPAGAPQRGRASTASITCATGQAVAQMEARRPSHLEVVDVLRGRIDAQLAARRARARSPVCMTAIASSKYEM